MKMPKMPKMPKMDKLLNDKNVLYIVFVVAILNILGYLVTNNLEAVMFFIIVGLLSTYFSKNMIIVLIIAIVFTSIFSSTRSPKVIYSKEGMNNMDNNTDKENDNTTDNTTDKHDITKKKQMIKDDIKKAENAHKTNNTNNTNNNNNNSSNDLEGMENSRPTGNQKKANRIDYATNLEEAYSNLQKSIGDGGIEGLTQQTGDLLKHQKELMDNINNMQPFLKTAESFMNNLDLSGLDGIGSILSKVTGKKNSE